MDGSRSASRTFFCGFSLWSWKGQITGQGAGPAGALAGHDAVDVAQLAGVLVGVELDARQPVERGADLLDRKGLKQELAGALAQAAQDEVRIVARG